MVDVVKTTIEITKIECDLLNIKLDFEIRFLTETNNAGDNTVAK